MPTKITKLLFIGCAFFIFLSACRNFYKATAINKNSSVEKASSIDSLKLQKRYFVLRNGTHQAFYMKEVQLSSDQKSLICTLDSLTPDRALYLKKGHNGIMQYKKTDPADLGILNQVHLYIPQDKTAAFGKYTLPLDKVQKIEVLQHDGKRTTNSYVIGAIGYGLGGAALAVIIVAATKSSCPFVSAYHDADFSLQGEIYGGAIYPQLARYDYMPLKMSPLPDGTLQVKISNELKERQYTDFADLLVVTHDKNSKAMVGEKGNIFMIHNPLPPISARLNQKNVLSSLLNPADNEILYMDDATSPDASNQLILHFKKPANVQKGRLVLTLKNSYWLDLLYGKLAEGFGSYYPTYIKQQKKKSADELNKWIREQQIPLIVSLKTSSGWEKIDEISTIGPLATRELAIPIDLAYAESENLELRLSSGFMFWEIDYAAIDFTENNNFSLQQLTPVKATDELGSDILPQIKIDDGRYLEQPEIGNVATLVYRPDQLQNPEKKRTYILKTKGYYEHIRNFENKPDIKFLKQFTQPNAFPLYGRNLYKKVNEESIKALASKSKN